MNIKKRCNKAGCRALINSHESYCPKHKQTTNIYYNKARNQNNPEYVNFYKSSDWVKTRYQALLRDEFLCRRCIEEHGELKEADLVHHYVETRDDWDKRLDIDNLISLCNTCHSQVHSKPQQNRKYIKN